MLKHPYRRSNRWICAEQFRRKAAEHVGGVFELRVFATEGHHEVELDAAGLLAERLQQAGRPLPPIGIW
jgi:acyl CoA:acetate/3-ketoacid CoA transferase alpha subunit